MLLLLIGAGCTSEPPVDSTNLVVVYAGTHQIGPPKESLTNNTIPRHVTLTYNYAIAKTEVSIGEWMAVTHSLPDQFCNQSTITMLTLEHPVRCVSWCDAIAFANKKSQQESLEPAYIFNDRTDELQHNIDCNERAQFVELQHKANGWRLPTEAEWEIASLANTTVPLEDRAWFRENSNAQPHAVGSKAPNRLGLFDMEGNLHEWIWERFGEFQHSTVTDPINYDVPIPSIYTRPIKGGAFSSDRSKLIPYNRPNASPSMRHPSIGFRLVRTIN